VALESRSRARTRSAGGGAGPPPPRAGRGFRNGPRAPKHDAHRAAFEFSAPRHDRDVAAADHELPGLLEHRPLRVAEVVEAIDELRLGQRLAAAQLQRPGEHLRKYRRALAVQPRIEQPRKADVVIADGETEQHDRDSQREGGQPDPAKLPPGTEPHGRGGPAGLRRGAIAREDF
jgi:hypothetical protein